MKRNFSLLALVLAVTFGVAACGGSNGDDAGSESSGETFNTTDVTFAQQMIPHHRQAVKMAKMAKSHDASPPVQQLAQKIKAAQGPEIETMTGWLQDWGKKLPDDSMSDMDHGTMDHDEASMPGMMSNQKMQDLQAAQGRDFDRMFLKMMIQHHSGAIEMAQTEQSKGKNPDAVALAEQIEKSQAAEIEQMKKLLDS